jgi:hypothetical protein
MAGIELCKLHMCWAFIFTQRESKDATFYNISAILWRLLLLVAETGLPGENHRPAASD